MVCTVVGAGGKVFLSDFEAPGPRGGREGGPFQVMISELHQPAGLALATERGLNAGAGGRLEP